MFFILQYLKSKMLAYRTFNDNIKMLVNLLDTLKKFNSKQNLFFSTSSLFSTHTIKQSNISLKEDVDLVIRIKLHQVLIMSKI